jgi:drug/metabolite transporter (DMT)-like permease
MIIKSRISLRLGLGLAVAIALDTVVQVFWKAASSTLDQGADGLSGIVHQPLFLVVAVLLACQLFNWLKVLDHADLSFAQPITSLSYVTVCACSAMFLEEHIDPLQTVGIALILVGVWFVSRTDPVTGRGDPAIPDGGAGQ